MNALTDEPLLDLAALEREIVARDREIANPYAKDLQVTAIHGARRYLADRITRVAAPHRILDPEAGPLIAVKLHILTRKTLGGLQTDLDGRVLQAERRAAARPLRRGRGRRLRRRRDARLPRARGHVPRRLPVLRADGRAGGGGRAGLSRRGTPSGTPTPQQPPCLALHPPGTAVLPPLGAPMQTQVLVQNGHPAIPAPVVTATDVVRRYGEGETAVDALRGVSVDIAAGRLTAVMGPSGSGKSTLMHILAGLDKPTSGEVTVAGVDISDLGDDELTKLRRDHIGFIFRFFNLLPMLTAAENIVLPTRLAGGKPDQAWLDEVVASVGLTERLSHKPSELSGGQQQRVAVARALVSRPSVMFADEPTGNLDSTTSGEILGLLRTSVDELGQTTVMVTHDAHAAAIADRVLFLADGDIVRDLGPSTAHEILDTLESVSGR